MINQDSDGLFDGDGEEPRELSWTETEWEKYLAEHEDSVRDYLKHYNQLGAATDRIDEVARRLGWEFDAEEALADEPEADDIENGFDSDWEPYTLHRNPIFISTKALYLSLIANWERIAAQPGRVSPALGLTMLSALYRGRENALQAVQALDLGDYALAICFFKRALRELNDTLARLQTPDQEGDGRLLARFRDYAQPRLFDLREIWLRVMSECRTAQGDE